MTRGELHGVLDQISFRSWRWQVYDKGDGFLIQVQFTDEGQLQKGRKWYISSHAVTAEVVWTAWLAIKQAVMHEAEEVFKYRGVPILNPHRNPQALVELELQGRIGAADAEEWRR